MIHLAHSGGPATARHRFESVSYRPPCRRPVGRVIELLSIEHQLGPVGSRQPSVGPKRGDGLGQLLAGAFLSDDPRLIPIEAVDVHCLCRKRELDPELLS